MNFAGHKRGVGPSLRRSFASVRELHRRFHRPSRLPLRTVTCAQSKVVLTVEKVRRRYYVDTAVSRSLPNYPGGDCSPTGGGLVVRRWPGGVWCDRQVGVWDARHSTI